MSTQYKHQQAFAHKLAMQWVKGDTAIREVIRGLKTKAQASYVAAYIMIELITWDDEEGTQHAEAFLNHIDPNKR